MCIPRILSCTILKILRAWRKNEINFLRIRIIMGVHNADEALERAISRHIPRISRNLKLKITYSHLVSRIQVHLNRTLLISYHYQIGRACRPCLSHRQARAHADWQR